MTEHLNSQQFSPYIPPERLHEVEGAVQGFKQRPFDEKHLVRHLAGTQVPVEHMKGITGINGSMRGMGEGIAATYTAGNKKGEGRIDLSFSAKDAGNGQQQRDISRSVTAHEIGHHVAHVHGEAAYMRSSKQFSDNTTALGMSEGEADNYAHAHVKTRGDVTSGYDREKYSIGKRFTEGYNNARQQGIQP